MKKALNFAEGLGLYGGIALVAVWALLDFAQSNPEAAAFIRTHSVVGFGLLFFCRPAAWLKKMYDTTNAGTPNREGFYVALVAVVILSGTMIGVYLASPFVANSFASMMAFTLMVFGLGLLLWGDYTYRHRPNRDLGAR
jgi:predicted MFS family arabinose efflux permease